MDKRKLSLVMDFYELTMSNSYFLSQKENQKAVFDVFYRNNPDNASYAIYCGLEQIIEYIQNLHFDREDIEYLASLNIFDSKFLEYLTNFSFKGDLYSFKEGSIIYPNEPIITVVAPLIDCQLIETMLLICFNHQSLIASKANRLVLASKNREIADFGARRSHGVDAAIYGARASYIGGASATATLLASKMFNIPYIGTMAHSYIMSFDSEYEAFLNYAKTYPDNCVLLIDTYDVIHSGILNAIKVAKDYLIPHGYNLKGVRIDSGDLAYLSKKVREILNKHGLFKTRITVSNALDEIKIASLIEQEARIDSFGVGENLITSKSSPVFGGVYKLVAIEENGKLKPSIKISETLEKINNPGLKEVYRIYSKKDKRAIADLITLKDEEVNLDQPYRFIDEKKPWKTMYFEDCYHEKLQHQIFKQGELVYSVPSIDEVKNYVRYQVNNLLWEEEKRFELPHTHYLDYSPSFYDLKMSLIKQHKYF